MEIYNSTLSRAVERFNPVQSSPRKVRAMKKESLLLGRMLKRIAPRIGAKVILEPEWGVVGQITFKNGRKSYFRYNTVDLNPTGASDIAKDKDYANVFMRMMGYPTVPGKTFFSASWARTVGRPARNIDAAYRYARKLGFPVIVKPNSGSQGSGVALVHNRREFYRAMRLVFQMDRVGLVQKFVRGKDYRIVILDGRLISAYERIPLSVLGDGRSTAGQLLRAKQKEFVASSRDTRIEPKDPRIREKLSHQGFSMRSVFPKGMIVYLLDNANLSSGGDAVDVTDKVHPEFGKLAVRLTRDMGLRLCGVDLIIDGDINKRPDKFSLLEVNAAPGLDHYAKGGKAREKIVEGLYLEVLKSLAK